MHRLANTVEVGEVRKLAHDILQVVLQLMRVVVPEVHLSG